MVVFLQVGLSMGLPMGHSVVPWAGYRLLWLGLHVA